MAPFATLASFVEARAMIVRVWQGVALQSKLSEHVAYIREHLLHTYLKTLGNRGTILLSRARADHMEFLPVSFWESASYLEALTGPEIDGALAKELISHSSIVKNYEVVTDHLLADGTPKPPKEFRRLMSSPVRWAEGLFRFAAVRRSDSHIKSKKIAGSANFTWILRLYK